MTAEKERKTVVEYLREEAEVFASRLGCDPELVDAVLAAKLYSLATKIEDGEHAYYADDERHGTSVRGDLVD